ncbi:unnamed protein product [Meloidogyne enterolobii]|uniref:Uncharacterized protein n=1 Tax=Meloidogyne enterolobii TaxID=390850 RepID=A0ACB0YBL3_MELEN
MKGGLFYFIILFVLFITLNIYYGNPSSIRSSKDNVNSCMFLGLLRGNGEYWLHQNFFNVTCVNGHIKAGKFKGIFALYF